jgi:uncharacterized membrane protein
MRTAKREQGPPGIVMKALIHRYVAAGTVFAVAALLTGVPLISGLACLLTFLLASVIFTAFQRRAHAGMTRTNTRPGRRPDRPRQPLNQDEISGYGWPTRDPQVTGRQL